jgi:hypothetical protein
VASLRVVRLLALLEHDEIRTQTWRKSLNLRLMWTGCHSMEHARFGRCARERM